MKLISVLPEYDGAEVIYTNGQSLLLLDIIQGLLNVLMAHEAKR